MNKTTPKFETKHVKHTFSLDERNTIGGDLARAIATLRGTEAEFEQVKASYKAKVTENESRIESLSTSLMNGFEMRNKRCLVVFRPAEKKKDFFPLTDEEVKSPDVAIVGREPVLTEDMTPGDFQTELVQAESAFECREEIDLFPPTETDKGLMVVGRLNGKWFSAVRVTVGKNAIEQRLDSEQRAYKQRFDAVNAAAKAAWGWLKDTLGKDNAKGFEDPIAKAVESHRERVE